MSSIMRGLKWFAAFAALALIACGGDGASRDAVAKNARSQLSVGDPATLALSVGGAGNGTVALRVDGSPVTWESCADPSVGQLCATVLVGSSVTLTADAAWGSSFVGFQAPYCDVIACDWTDPDFLPAKPFAWSNVNPYAFTMDADKAVRAMFWPGSTLTASTVTLVVAGPGAGTIKGAAGGASFAWDAGAECPAGATCTSTVPFTPGTAIELTATADAATSSFQGFQAPFCEVNDCGPLFGADPEFVPPDYAWTGSPYTFSIDGPRTVNAKFASQMFTLKVSGLRSTYGTVSVTGTATANGVPQAVAFADLLALCGGVTGCSMNLPTGAVVSLTAPTGLVASSGVFTGWSGACSGTGACNVTLDASKTVTANFVPYQPPVMYSLVTNVTGVAVGDLATITRSPAGNPLAGGQYARTTPLTVVTLTAQVPANYRFVRWYGCDSQPADPGGSSLPPQCKVTMGYSRTVTAVYAQTVPITLTVVSGASASPAAVNIMAGGAVKSCVGAPAPGNTCTVPVDKWSSVSVQATSGGVATPVKWAGTCANLVVPGCSIYASAALTATATFP